MSDPHRREFERYGSPFWGLGLVFAVVMIALIAYAYHGAHTIPGMDSTGGQVPGQSSQPASQK